jgi:hypothetical protein
MTMSRSERAPTDMKPHGAFITALRADWESTFGNSRPFRLWVLPGLLDRLGRRDR